jgi:alpha-1,6-mannosyltransferase
MGHRVPSGMSSVLMVGTGSGLLYSAMAMAQRALHQGPGPDRAMGLPPQIIPYVAATLGLFALYCRLLVVCGRGGLRTRNARMLAIGLPMLFNALLLLLPPSLSIDLLSYISHGHLRSVQDANPYVVPSSAVAHSTIGPELASYGWRPVHPVTPYGPAWTHLEVGVAALFDGVRAQLVVLKLIAVMFSLGSAALIWLILGRVRPEKRLLGTLAYLWNPVIVVELAGEGHNDAVMVLLALLALALTVQHRAVSGIATMALGVLTKYLPLLLIPLQAVYLWRTRGSAREFTARVITGAGVAAALAVLLFSPFWVGLDTLDGIRMSGQGANTGATQTVVTGLLSPVIPPEVVRPLLLAFAVAGLVGYLAALAASVTDARSLLLACAWVSTAYLLVVSPTYWPWYAVLPVALLALTPQGLSVQLLVAVSLGSRLAAPLDMVFVHQLIDRRMYLLLTWCAGVGLPLLLLALSLARRLRASSSLPRSGDAS